MTFLALPFAFRLGRRGTLYGVGLGIALAVVQLAAFAFTSTLGSAGALDPLVAVWSPNVAFILLGLYLFLGTRT